MNRRAGSAGKRCRCGGEGATAQAETDVMRKSRLTDTRLKASAMRELCHFGERPSSSWRPKREGSYHGAWNVASAFESSQLTSNYPTSECWKCEKK
jgi:hypothetical protein